ncbi:MAG: response regulator [Bryobacteraceae bacterium]|nr:response regulator [Bryobacteraceae bacterium]
MNPTQKPDFVALRVLVVEDEQIVAADLEQKLIQIGHNVVGLAATSAEAIRSAEQFRPDLVLMDIHLEGEMSGTVAARSIRETTGAQIIFVTAYAGVFLRDPEQMLPPGICLSKPFSLFQLQAILETLKFPRVSE